MPYGPGGAFSAISLPGSWNPATTGSEATPEAWNLLLADLTTGLSNAITKNGLTTPTANLPMGGYRWTGVGDATARTMFASAGQVQDNSLAYGTAGGTADVATLTLAPAVTVYRVGQVFAYLAPGTTTITNPTLNVNGLGAGVVVQAGGGALPVGGIISGGLTTVAVIDAATPVFQLLVGRAPVSTAGGTITGTLTMSGAAINEAIRVDVASATTTDIGAAASNYVQITGTTTITGLGTIASGVRRKVVFGGILILTHNATSLILPNNGANITTAAGDTAEFESEGSGNWRCTDYQRASGAALGPGPGYTATDTSTSVSGSYSTPMTITEGVQLFSHSYTGRNGNTLLIAADLASCYGQNSSVALSIFINGATNAVETSIVTFPNTAAAGYPNRVLYSLVSGGTATAVEIRAAGSPISTGTAVLSISEFV